MKKLKTEVPWKSPDEPPDHMEPLLLSLVGQEILSKEEKGWVVKGWYDGSFYHTDKPCLICNMTAYVFKWSEWPEPATERIEKSSLEKTLNMSPGRRLSYLFLTLPYSERMEVIAKMGVLQPDDERLEKRKRYKELFERSMEQGRLSDLWDAVACFHGGASRENPFVNLVETERVEVGEKESKESS